MRFKNIFRVLLIALVWWRPFLSASAYPYEDTVYSLALLAVAFLALGKTTKLFQRPSVSLHMILLILAIYFSTIFSASQEISFALFYQWAVLIVVFFAVAGLPEKFKRMTVGMLWVNSGCIGIYALFWLLKGTFYTLDMLMKNGIRWAFAYEYLSRGRSFVPFVLPSSLASYCILLLPLSVAFLYAPGPTTLRSPAKISVRNVCSLVIFLALALTLITTQSLGAFLSLGIALIIFALGQRNKSVQKATLIGLSVCIVFGLIALFIRNTNVHAFNLPMVSLTQRLAYWRHALTVIAQEPLFGHGIGNYPFFHGSSPHNSYLQMWAETGILGFIAFVGIAYHSLKIDLTGLLKPQRTYYQALWLGNLAILIHNLVDFSLMQPEVALQWWVIVALLASATNGARTKNVCASDQGSGGPAGSEPEQQP
ncbi:MAG: O-antigen ligase family protein, partial [Candidatus Omnitrophota bacterium]